MLYANVSNAINAFGTGDSDVVGDTMTVLYSDNPDNSTMYSLVIGHTNITWDQAAVYNETFLDSFTPQQLAVLVFDVFGRIFLSYDLHPPDDYENLLHQLADGEVANDESTYESLLIMLVARFIISAVYYVVAAVWHPSGDVSDLVGLAFDIEFPHSSDTTLAKRSVCVGWDIYATVLWSGIYCFDRCLDR